MGSLTFAGMSAAMKGVSGAATGSSIANTAASVRLYAYTTSTPAKGASIGSGFTEVSTGNGYTTGGIAIATADWTFTNDGTNGLLTLATKSWTASGGNIADIGGFMICNGAGAVLGWEERSAGAVTLSPPDTYSIVSSGFQLT